MRPTTLVIALLAAGNLGLGILLLRPPTPQAQDPASGAVADSEATIDSTATAVAQNPTVASAESAQSAELEALRTENAKRAQEIEDLKNELSVYNARRQRPSSAPQRSFQAVPAGPLMSMLNDDSTVDLALDWIRADQSQRFASLIALADLGPEEKSRLLQLLTDRYAHRSDLNHLGIDALPPEELREMEAEYRRKLESAVGEPMAEMFLKAETKPLSFARIQELDTLLRFEGEPLAQDQYLPLWNLLSSTIQVGVRFNDAESVAAVTERGVSNNLGILPEAQRLLSPTQFAAFQERIQADITNLRVRERIMLQRFEERDSEATAAPTAP